MRNLKFGSPRSPGKALGFREFSTRGRRSKRAPWPNTCAEVRARTPRELGFRVFRDFGLLEFIELISFYGVCVCVRLG